jgi:hypothetical protein
MTSSAPARIAGGVSTPTFRVVFWLMTSRLPHGTGRSPAIVFEGKPAELALEIRQQRRSEDVDSLGAAVVERREAHSEIGRTFKIDGRQVTTSPRSTARTNSIVFRLIGRLKFVDRRRNSIDPVSNEFAA